MSGKQCGTGRFYSILRTVILIITILAGMSAAYYGYIVGSGSVQTEWSGYCKQYKDPLEYSNCMMLSSKLIEKFKRLLWINIAIAVALPVLYGIGVWFYKNIKRTQANIVNIGMLCIAALCIFGFCSYVSAEASRWKLFSESHAFSWYYDENGMDHSNKNVIRVWAKSAVKGRTGIDEKIKLLKKFGGQTKGYEDYSYTVNLFELDCKSKKQRVISVKDYDSQGNTLETATMENSPWDYVPPGTIAESLFKAVCK